MESADIDFGRTTFGTRSEHVRNAFGTRTVRRYPFEGSHTGIRRYCQPALLAGPALRSLVRSAAFDWLKNMRSAGCDALWLRLVARTWPLGLDFASSGVILERSGSIFEAETAIFSMLLRARARPQRTCCDCASDMQKLMFRAHWTYRGTRRERHKIEQKSVCEPSGKLFR